MNNRYTCLFGGGAIRGVSYIGAIKAFEELGIDYDILGGSSVGSIFAAMLAVGYNAEEFRDIFSKVNFNLFKDILIGLGPLFAVSKGEVFLEWIRDIIESKFYGDDYKKGSNKAVTFKDLKQDLVIITTNLADFSCKEFSKIETPDYEVASAIRISCCMPGLMKPIEYNNMLLVDGDLQKSKPMWMLSNTLKNSESRIMELRLEGYYENNDISGIDYANAVYSCMTAVATDFISGLYAENDKYEYITLNTGEILVVDFNINDEKRSKLIQSGYIQVMDYFNKKLPEKRSKIMNCYMNISEYLHKILQELDYGNVQKAKNILGDLFIDLSECYGLIDAKDFKSLKDFKDLFILNIKHPALFGKTKLKNEHYVRQVLLNLQNIIKQKF